MLLSGYFLALLMKRSYFRRNNGNCYSQRKISFDCWKTLIWLKNVFCRLRVKIRISEWISLRQDPLSSCSFRSYHMIHVSKWNLLSCHVFCQLLNQQWMSMLIKLGKKNIYHSNCATVSADLLIRSCLCNCSLQGQEWNSNLSIGRHVNVWNSAAAAHLMWG